MSMHVFVTGSTGWVGSAVIDELLLAGHSVTGLVRSKEKATALSKTGAKPVIATLEELDILQADAVIHTAFNHDFSRFSENCVQDKRAIEAMGNALKEADKPLLVTSGLMCPDTNRPLLETDAPESLGSRQSEIAAREFAKQGVHAATVRLAPSVHGLGDHGFVPTFINIAREKGLSAYIGDGKNLWSAVHRLDAARVYLLALESGMTEPVYQRHSGQHTYL